MPRADWLFMSKPIGGLVKRPAPIVGPIVGKAEPKKARGTPEQELQRKCANVHPEAKQKRCVDEFVRGETDRMMKQGADLIRSLRN